MISLFSRLAPFNQAEAPGDSDLPDRSVLFADRFPRTVSHCLRSLTQRNARAVVYAGAVLAKRELSAFQLMDTAAPTREEMVRLLNEDLAREYQAIIAYVVYSQTLKGAKFQHVADELEKHAAEELEHALKIAAQIDYFNGTPVTVPKEVKLSDKPEDMLRFDLENERVTILNYRQRIRQAEAMGEFALSATLREIIVEEQDHLTELADALGIDNPSLEG